MAKARTTVLIAVESGPLRDGLKALLGVLPQVEVVAEAKTAWQAVALAGHFRPDVVVADAGLDPAGAWRAMRELKAVSPDSRRIFLADDVLSGRAGDEGAAEVILLKGSPAADLLAAIEQLLPADGVSGANPALADMTDNRTHETNDEGEHDE